jgi:hypothetical protein
MPGRRTSGEARRQTASRRRLESLLRREIRLGLGEPAAVKRCVRAMASKPTAAAIEELGELGLSTPARMLAFYQAVVEAMGGKTVIGEAQILALQALASAFEFDPDVAALWVRWVQDSIELDARGQAILGELGGAEN